MQVGMGRGALAMQVLAAAAAASLTTLARNLLIRYAATTVTSTTHTPYGVP